MEWDRSSIRALRAALRLTREKFAFQLGAAPKTVQNWEDGRYPPGLALMQALDGVWESATPEQKERFLAYLSPAQEAWQAEEVSREKPLPGNASAALPARSVPAPPPDPAPPVAGLEDLKHIAAALDDARRYVDIEVVEYFRRRIASCAASDRAHGPKQTLPVALGVVTAIESSSGHVKAAVRAPLLAVGAQGAELVAWLYRDLGMSGMADYWRDRALDWAKEAGDLPMQAYVVLKKAQAAWDARDAPRMLALARAVREGPWGAPPRVLAEAAQQEARGHAMLGADVDMVERMLDEARGLLGDDNVDEGSEFGGRLSAHFGPRLLAMQVAICYCEAGRPVRAVDVYRDQLDGEVFSRRDYGYFLSLMASALTAAGEPGEASRIAIDGLGIALATDSRRTTNELLHVAARLQPWRRHPPVREFYDALGASGIAVNPP